MAIMHACGVALPTYGGYVTEDFVVFAHKLFAYLRISGIAEEDDARKQDILLLALVRGSPAERFLLLQPAEARPSIQHAMHILSSKFAGPNRREATKQAAINALHVRSFRDDKHRGEAVQDLVNDFERCLPLAQIDDDREKREQFLWAFRKYPAATRMLNKSFTLDGAILEALRWEKILIERAGATMPTSV